MVRRSYKMLIRNFDFEYYITDISLQTIIDSNYLITFTLSVPTLFYENNPNYYENLFNGIYFLVDEKKS